mmetsp:Transcript_9104/g.29169  ORF Transcript_9104/g.29169 Transcript_9104/m.29169 type:complete len:211 (+) Transcript_9104:1298-1930(+)
MHFRQPPAAGRLHFRQYGTGRRQKRRRRDWRRRGGRRVAAGGAGDPRPPQRASTCVAIPARCEGRREPHARPKASRCQNRRAAQEAFLRRARHRPDGELGRGRVGAAQPRAARRGGGCGGGSRRRVRSERPCRVHPAAHRPRAGGQQPRTRGGEAQGVARGGAPQLWGRGRRVRPAESAGAASGGARDCAQGKGPWLARRLLARAVRDPV